MKVEVTDALAREALDQLDEGCQIIGFDWKYLYVNDALTKQGRLSRDELLGHTMQERYAGIEQTPVFAAFRQCMRDRQPLRLETEYGFPDGPRSFAVRIYPVPQGIAVFSVDTTELGAELARARDAATRADARLATLLEQAPDGVFVADLEGRYTEVNEAACRMLGFTREELLGKRITDLISPQDRARLWEQREGLLAGGVQVREWSLIRKDGTVLSTEISAKILTDGRWQAVVRDITQRRQAEQALRQSEERLRLASQAAGFGTFEFVFATGENYLSPEVRTFFGLPVDARPPRGLRIDGDTSWMVDRLHPEDRARVREKLAACLAGNGSVDVHDEHRVLQPDGPSRWLRMDARLFVDGQQRPLRWAGTVRDITERKALESKLQWAEATSSGILEVSADAIICIDREQRITLFNQGAEQIFGYSKHEALGSPLELLLPERLRALHRTHVESFASSPASSRQMAAERRASLFGLRRNGQEFPIDAAISRLPADGHTVLTVSLRDISEQRQAEQQHLFLDDVGAVLAQSLDSEETLREIAALSVRELADFCFVAVAAERGPMRRLVCASREASKNWVCDLLSQAPWEPSAAHPAFQSAETLKPVLLPSVTPELMAAMSTNEAHRRGLLALEARSTLTVPLVAGGRALGVIGLVSSHGSFQPAQVRLAEELGRRASLALENARLYGRAQQAIREREDLASIVAHDLRNPLQTVLLHARVLRNRSAEAEWVARPLEAIERAVNRMTRLIQDLLDVGRLEAGPLPIAQSRVPVGPLMAEVIDAQRALAATAALELHLEVAPALPDLWADRDRLLQVFENLIGNALKFTRRGGRIAVRAALDGAQVLFEVADTGVGVRPDDLPRLFERYWQAERASRKGAGLGLPITRGIVEAHGGRIWVESEEGQGTIFRFTVPVAPAEQTAR